VDVRGRVLRVVEVEQELAADDADGDGADGVAQRLAEAEAVERAPGGDVGAGDRRAARAAVRLEDVAVEPQRPLTERLEVGDGTDRTADQPLDLDGPAFLAPRARLALRTRARRGRQERVLGGHPPYSPAGQPPRNPL